MKLIYITKKLHTKKKQNKPRVWSEQIFTFIKMF